ncbi:4'-phosphopantetheinyl transferase family protein [Aquimarina aggregata]|uniref:4'-phosphopantetheinyl transferase family protein n=1 Tax=Aquimarina aggregata TaxID=1642818 RepID=UPI002493B1F9|nr:4'-phosphopantetheinyl transferase superfamily protein [Aquimarina aggregata]
MNYKGEIILKRTQQSFKVGFSILYKNLECLSKDVDKLHPREKNYYETLKFDKRKKSYLLGRLSAKEAIAELLDKKEDIHNVCIDFGVFQFPVVKNTRDNIQVTISHCSDYGISLAYPEEHPLGIDIEKIEKDKIKTFKSMITDQEEILLQSSFFSILQGCTLIWTVKEAMSKVIKTGFTLDLNFFEIDTIKYYNEVIETTFKNFGQYKAFSFISGTYVCSIVLPKRSSINLNGFKKAFKNSTEITHN